MPQQQSEEMMNVILIGGKFAGLKTRIPKGRKMMNIPDLNKVQLAVVKSHEDLQRHIQSAKEAALLAPGVQRLEDCDNPYMLWPCVVTLPTMNDVMSFTIGCPPGTKMTDAFMEMIAGYCMMSRPEDYGDDDG